MTRAHCVCTTITMMASLHTLLNYNQPLHQMMDGLCEYYLENIRLLFAWCEAM